MQCKSTYYLGQTAQNIHLFHVVKASKFNLDNNTVN